MHSIFFFFKVAAIIEFPVYMLTVAVPSPISDGVSHSLQDLSSE